MNMNHPVSNAFSMEIVPPDQQATTNSVRMLSWSISWMVTTPLGGWMIERYGFTPNMVGTMGLYLVSCGLFWGFFRGIVIPVTGRAPTIAPPAAAIAASRPSPHPDGTTGDRT